MKPFLMGSETEYSISGRSRRGPQQPIRPEQLIHRLLDAVRQDTRWLPDAGSSGGMFLEQGGRLYPEINGHPEYATPESATPAQVAAYDKAGERLLLRAGERLAREQNIDVTIWKGNLGVINPDRVTFGSHESYLCWAPLPEVAPQLLPHLVSRTIFAGSGCLSAHTAGFGFELSQRARHMVRAIGEETTSDRAIFCTRVRKASDAARDGWTRVHLIAKDSHRCPLGTYLTFGSTGLLFWAINQGKRVGQGLALANPVQALRTISLDPWLQARVPLADGRQLTALEIQECCLTECERYQQGGCFPDWAPAVLTQWRQTLEQLARDPLTLAQRLDPYLKLAIFEHQRYRAGYQWAHIRQALQLQHRLRERYPEPMMQALLAEDPSLLPDEVKSGYDAAMAEIGAHGSAALDRLRFLVRLQVLELQCQVVGGLHDDLARSGKVESVVVSDADITRAMTEPPPGGRAAARSQVVKAHHSEQGWMCDWACVTHPPTKTVIDMRDPFTAEHRFGVPGG